MKKKIYIAGAGGMLGEAFYQVFKKDYNLKLTDKDVNEEWISKLDFNWLYKIYTWLPILFLYILLIVYLLKADAKLDDLMI